MIKLRDILLENEDWWDNSKSFNSQQSSKEQENQNQQNLLNQLNQYTGKSIYLKFPWNVLGYMPETKSKLEAFYSNPIKFTIYKVSSNEFQAKGNMIYSKKDEGWFSSKWETKNIDIRLNISFYLRDSISLESTISNSEDFMEENKIKRVIYEAEYITKDSAMLLFDIAKKINPNFKPSMNSIIIYGPYKNQTIPIK